MGKYPKQLLFYREMESMLNNTDIQANIEGIFKYHLDEKERFNEGLDSKFGLNLFTSQAIEIFREIVIHSGINKKINILDIKLFHKIIGKYSLSKQPLERERINKEKENPWLLVTSMYNKQFWYQKIEHDIYSHLNFYLNYYKEIGFDKYIEKQLGFNIERLLIVGFLLYDLSNQKKYLSLLTEESIFKEEEKFIISNYSIELFELKEKLKEENKKEAIFSNITTMEYYGLDIIFDRPLLNIKDMYVCPFPVLLINRITNALYYIFSRDFMKDEYGEINQSFITKLLLNIDSKYTRIDTNQYKKDYIGKTTPPNPDVIISDNKYTFFIECKSNSLQYDSVKNGLNTSDKKRIKENIEQIYKAITYYINKVKTGEKYFGIIKQENQIIIPIITYIKNPYICSGKYLKEIMEEVLQNPLIENDIVKNYPIRIMENKNIIELVNIINKLGMNEFYNEIINEKYNSWEFENIISEINKKINTKDSVNYEYDFIKILEDEGKKFDINIK